MPLSFPNTPYLNQVYSYGSLTWSWNGKAWKAIGTAQGLQGIQGPQGIQGLLGTQGIQGVQGPQGIQGLLGIQGIQGVQGLNGLFAAQGIQGLTGSQGITGTAGSGTSGTLLDHWKNSGTGYAQIGLLSFPRSTWTEVDYSTNVNLSSNSTFQSYGVNSGTGVGTHFLNGYASGYCICTTQIQNPGISNESQYMRPNWSYAKSLSFRLQTYSFPDTSTGATFFGLYGYLANNASYTLTGSGFGVKIIDRRFWIVCHNGTSLTQTDTGISMGGINDTTGIKDILVYNDATGTVYLYLNGVSVASSSGGPTSSSANLSISNGPFFVAAAVGGTADLAKYVVSSTMLLTGNI